MAAATRLRAGAVIVACLLLAGCGGGEGKHTIPADASVKDFCKASQTFSKATKFSEGVKDAHKLRDTGTPKGIPAGARDGFEVVVALVTDSRNQADLEKRYQKLTAKQRKSVEKLDAYIRKKC